MVHDLAEWRKVRAKCLGGRRRWKASWLTGLWKDLRIKGTQYLRKQGDMAGVNLFESLCEEQLDPQSPLLLG